MLRSCRVVFMCNWIVHISRDIKCKTEKINVQVANYISSKCWYFICKCGLEKLKPASATRRFQESIVALQIVTVGFIYGDQIRRITCAAWNRICLLARCWILFHLRAENSNWFALRTNRVWNRNTQCINSDNVLQHIKIMTIPYKNSWKWQNDKMTKKRNNKNKNKTMIAKSKWSKHNKTTERIAIISYILYINGISYIVRLSSSVESNGPIFILLYRQFLLLLCVSFIILDFEEREKRRNPLASVANEM